ncbi:hypothetical protein AF6_0304 [Anoxybacillus flavithermus TNO-09.006]|nr:hypothetical protein CA592_12530 [Anoxybacillus flavithermus]ELK23041.1 hypothetical protein AF6_0304 [Anoxybacillus flavithermus TNO-09.006]
MLHPPYYLIVLNFNTIQPNVNHSFSIGIYFFKTSWQMKKNMIILFVWEMLKGVEMFATHFM